MAEADSLASSHGQPRASSTFELIAARRTTRLPPLLQISMKHLRKFREKGKEAIHSFQRPKTPLQTADASPSSTAAADAHAAPITSAGDSDPSAGASDSQPTANRAQPGSRSAPWIDRAIYLLELTGAVAEAGGDLLAPLKAACEVTVMILEEVQAVNETREAWRGLIDAIKEHEKSLTSALALGEFDVKGNSQLAEAFRAYGSKTREILDQVLESVPKSIADEDIRKATRWEKLRELAKGLGVSESEAESIKDYQDSLGKLQGDIKFQLVIYIAARTNINEEHAQIKTLQVAGVGDLPQPEGCMDGTRQGILNEILEWSKDTTKPNILWVKGHPGCGKSAIARSAADKIEKSLDVELGCIFVFQRQQAALLKPNSLWRTVAYELAKKFPPVRQSLAKGLKDSKITLNNPNIEELFQHLIIDSTGLITSTKPVVVVIDALDECGGVEGRLSKDRMALMCTLKQWPSLPSSMKLLVTSRAEDDIERAFKPGGTDRLLVEIPVGSKAELESEASKDIRLFLTQRFKEIAESYSESLPANWPESDIIKELTRRAMGLFIWAATVIRLVREGEPEVTLKEILEHGPDDQNVLDSEDVPDSLDVLYARVLSLVFKRPQENDLKTFHAVAGAVIVAETPLSQSALSQLLNINRTAVERVCQGLRSVLQTEDLLQFRHQSFVDFLLNPKVSEKWFAIKLEREHATLALGCLRTMDKGLRFNICDIPSSYKANKDVPNIDSKIRKHVTQSLSYASFYWGQHLSKAAFEDVDKGDVFQLIHKLQCQNFLFWLEVLSLTKRLNLGPEALSALKQWLQHGSHQDTPKLIRFADDMIQFIWQFGSAISCSVPHIYLSALPLAPAQSMVLQQYKQHYPQMLSIQSGGNSCWPTLHSAITGHTSTVLSVAFSPDGSRIVSGSGDSTIRIWDAASGEPVGEPLRAHTDQVWSVAFSPDGSRIVSGSHDDTIRIWDAASGEPVGEPLRGHPDEVTSVAFSADGSRIASGSRDTTIQVLSSHTTFQYTLPNILFLSGPPQIHLDGWIYGLNKELIVWVPPNMRAGLTLPNYKILGGDFVHTSVDLCRFKHGSSWAQCRVAPSS